jgi:uncharacterized protein YecT (DUF1311 family)
MLVHDRPSGDQMAEADLRCSAIVDRLFLRVVALLVISACPVAAVDLSAADRAGTAEQRQCMGDLFRATSQELAHVYQQALEKAATSDSTAPKRDGPARPTLADDIAKSQKAWEPYRDAE